MSRKIKFRRWDGNKKEMMFDAIKLAIVIGASEVESKTGNIHHFMQFTGLKDNLFEDIYDGDIVSDHVGIGMVEYSEKHAGFRVNYRNGQCKWFYDYILNGERESIRRIGNIYENPELIPEDNRYY